LVRATLQPLEHPPCVSQIARLAHDFAIQKHQRVRAQHQVVGNFLGDGPRLAMRVELADLQRGKMLVHYLIRSAGHDAKFHR